VRLRMFPTDAGRTAGTRPLQCRGVALGHRTAKAPAKGLSTLNSMAFGLAVSASQRGLPRATPDSLPAAGQALPGGLSTRKVPLKGFRSVVLHLIPPSQASLAQSMCPTRATFLASDLRHERCFMFDSSISHRYNLPEKWLAGPIGGAGLSAPEAFFAGCMIRRAGWSNTTTVDRSWRPARNLVTSIAGAPFRCEWRRSDRERSAEPRQWVEGGQ